MTVALQRRLSLIATLHTIVYGNPVGELNSDSPPDNSSSFAKASILANIKFEIGVDCKEKNKETPDKIIAKNKIPTNNFFS